MALEDDPVRKWQNIGIQWNVGRTVVSISAVIFPTYQQWRQITTSQIADGNIDFVFPRSLVASDECGLVAGLLHFAPENVWCTFLNIMNTIFLVKSHAPGAEGCSKSGKKKKKRPKLQLRKHPPNVKIIAYLIFGRIGAPLEHWQPEGQHGKRQKRRIVEHLLAANMVIDKPLTNTPLWIVSLDFPKGV